MSWARPPEDACDVPDVRAHLATWTSTIGNLAGQMNAGNVAAVATTGLLNSFFLNVLNVSRLGFSM